MLGKRAYVKITKNKVAPPFKRCEFDIMFGEGISRAGELLDLGVDYNIIQKSGSWFSYDGAKLAQGRDAAKAVIADNPELADELATKILAAMREADRNPVAARRRAATATVDTDTTALGAASAAPADADALFDDTLDDEFSIEEDE